MIFELVLLVYVQYFVYVVLIHRMCDFLCEIAVLAFFHLKVISSTCRQSSKTTGNSSGKNMEFSFCWTPYAFITGETPYPNITYK